MNNTQLEGPIISDQDSDNDYTLADGQSAWIRLPGGKVLHISAITDTASLHVDGEEMEYPISVMAWQRN